MIRTHQFWVMFSVLTTRAVLLAYTCSIGMGQVHW